MTQHPARSARPDSPLSRRVASRRAALGGVAVVGMGAPLLAACGSDTATDAGPAGSTGSASSTPSTATSDAAAGGTTGLATTTDIAVGGGEIFSDEEVVIVQPSAGEFVGYSAVCTHQGCLVGSVTSEGIVCPCHNSVFSLADGEPVSGPAQSALGSVALTVSGDQISLA